VSKSKKLSGAAALFFVLVLVGFSHPLTRTGGGAEGSPAADSSILVLAAASLSDVLPMVAQAWEAGGGIPVRFSFGATSRLAPQTVRGAPADLFFSADGQWMDWVEARGGVAEGTRVALLRNRLVVVVPSGSSFHPGSASELTVPSLEHLALAGENVPAGRYARSALEAEGVWGALEPRIVRAGNVRRALEWVALGEVDAAVVYATDATVEGRVRMGFSFPAEAHLPIVYPAAVLDGAPFAKAAGEFLEFCGGPEAAGIFREAGFEPAPMGLQPPAASLLPVAGTTQAPHPDPWSAIRLSFMVALAATLAGFVPAVCLGWVLARKEFPGKSILATVALAPLVLPPVVTGFLLLSLLGSQGPLGRWLAHVGVPVPFTLLGATLAALTVGLPLYIVSVRNAFQTVDPTLEEVSLTLGRKPFPTFLRVTFPLALPGIAAGSVLAFARALGEFGATVVLAGNMEGSTRTIALAVYTLLESPQGREAIWVLVGASVALSLLALLGYEVLSRRQRSQMEVRRGR
jgi:molybdate transport system permease protein